MEEAHLCKEDYHRRNKWSSLGDRRWDTFSNRSKKGKRRGDLSLKKV